jgi:hypothetical protein
MNTLSSRSKTMFIVMLVGFSLYCFHETTSTSQLSQLRENQKIRTINACVSFDIIVPTMAEKRYLYLLLLFFFFLLNPALPSWKMSVFVSLLAMFGTSQSLAFVPQINTVPMLGAPMLPTRWVKISIYLQSERFLFIINIL